MLYRGSHSATLTPALSSPATHLRALAQLEQVPAAEMTESGEWASVCPALRTALAQATASRPRLLRLLEQLVEAARVSSAAQQLLDLGVLLGGDALDTSGAALHRLALQRHPLWLAEAALRRCWQARRRRCPSLATMLTARSGAVGGGAPAAYSGARGAAAGQRGTGGLGAALVLVSPPCCCACRLVRR